MGLDHSPLIATNYLAYFIDAANPRCYIGSGVTLNGLVSGNGGSLVSGVGFGSTGTNYFIFDGVDDGIPFYIPNAGSTLTLETWVKIKTVSNGMIFGFYLYDVWINTGRLGFNTASSDIYGLTSTQVTNLNLLNQWNHYVFEMRTDVSYSNNKIYINGQNQSLSQVTGTETVANRTFNSGNGRIGCWLYSTSFFQNMDIGQFKVYNRALSSAEVLQNYNATKGRYGL